MKLSELPVEDRIKVFTTAYAAHAVRDALLEVQNNYKRNINHGLSLVWNFISKDQEFINHIDYDWDFKKYPILPEYLTPIYERVGERMKKIITFIPEGRGKDDVAMALVGQICACIDWNSCFLSNESITDTDFESFLGWCEDGDVYASGAYMVNGHNLSAEDAEEVCAILEKQEFVDEVDKLHADISPRVLLINLDVFEGE